MSAKLKKIIAAYNSANDPINHVDYKPPGTSVWTRGDGTRYRDPGQIIALYGKDGRMINSAKNKEPVKAFAEWLKSYPRTKHIGGVKDWHGSSQPRDAYTLGGILFTIDTDGRIEFGSTSRLRNSDVWRHKPKESMEMNESEKKYRVTAKSLDDDSTFKGGLKSKADADKEAEKMRKAKNKRGGKSFDNIKVVAESQLNEGVLDDQDDDGFMAKRQLYDLAKYAVELHRMIQDTDNLEPWVQAKITKAADYIDTVKHYLEYNDVRDAEATADVMGPPEMDDIDAVGNELDTMLSMETEVMEYGDEDEGSEVHPEDVLFWAVRRGIITPEQEDQAQIDQSSQLMMAAQDTADSIGRVWEIGSSDVSIWMRQFIDTCKAYGIKCDGPKAHLYESQLKAKMIYRNMLRELREKK